MKKILLFSGLILAFVALTNQSSAQLSAASSSDANALIDLFLADSPNLTYSNATVVGVDGSSGTYMGADFGNGSGVILSTGQVTDAEGPNSSIAETTNNGSDGDADLDEMLGVSTNDAAAVQADIVPDGGELSFNYVYASEDYNSYVCSPFSDGLGVIIDGGEYDNENIALVPSTDLFVGTNTVNSGDISDNIWQPAGCPDGGLSNSAFYVDNTDGLNYEYNGASVVLTGTIPVTPGETYTVKWVIADANDALFDSALFLESGSLTSTESECDVAGGTLTVEGPDVVCKSDGIDDPFSLSVEGNEGENQVFVATFLNGNIIFISENPDFNLEGVPGNGTCLFWSLSWNGEITGAEVGLNANDIEGDCFELSNPVPVTEYFTDGGTITTQDPTTFCVDDGEDDLVDVELEGDAGQNSAWVITDDDLNILGLPPGPPFNFEGAGEGACLIWHLSWSGDLEGAAEGENAADLSGDCFSLSNPIEVIRESCSSPADVSILTLACGGQILQVTGAFEGSTDGGDATAETRTIYAFQPDNAGGSPAYTGSAWPYVIVPDGFSADPEISANLTVGDDDILLVNGWPAYQFVNDVSETDANGTFGPWFYFLTDGAISQDACEDECDVEISDISTSDPTEFCGDDGESNLLSFSAATVSGEFGYAMITDSLGNIFIVSDSPFTGNAVFFFTAFPAGQWNIYAIASDEELDLQEGDNIFDLEGCLAISNPIPLTVTSCEEEPCDVDGGTISTDGPTTICKSDGVDDIFSLDLEGNVGENQTFVVTWLDGEIILTSNQSSVNLEGIPGNGICLFWSLSWNGEIEGLEPGLNAFDVTGDCFEFSNSIEVTEYFTEGGTISTDGPTMICKSDGVDDIFSLDLEGEAGQNQTFVVTWLDGEIILTSDQSSVNLEGIPGNGVCLFWSLSWSGEIEGLEPGLNAFDITGDCFDFSNSIEVTEYYTLGGEISTDDETTICVGDGVPDPIDVSLDGDAGMNSGWVITDDNLNILALPDAPPFDLEGAGTGVCLIWHLSWSGELMGAEVGENAADLSGDCFSLSNSIAVNRIDCSTPPSANAVEWQHTLMTSPNPNSGTALVTYSSNKNARTQISVFNMNGQQVLQLFNEQAVANVKYTFQLDGAHLPNGVYFYQITDGIEVRKEKFIIAR